MKPILLADRSLTVAARCGPDGKVIAKDLRGEQIKAAVEAALGE